MKSQKEAVKAYLKKIGSDLHSAIVGLIVVGLVGALGGIYLFAENVWIFIKNTLQEPTPLWGTVALVLVLLAYIYGKGKLINSSQPRRKNNFKTKYFTIGPYKWETKIYESGNFEVDKYPFCTKHDLRFIFGARGKYCPGTETERCNNRLSENDEFNVFESSKSIIEREVRKINSKC